MHLKTVFVLATAMVSVVLGQGNASAADLAAVDAANSGFGINLTSTALITATYPRGEIVNGRTYPPSRLATQPNITITASDALNTSASFVLTLADASALDDPDALGNYRHWLADDLVLVEAGGNGSFVLAGGTTVTDYVGPGPFAGTGVHRYSFLLFQEPDGFTPPANLSAAGTGPGHWYVSDYVQQTGVTLVAASFFRSTNENGQTGPVAASTASSSLASAPIRTSIPLSASITAFLSSAV